MAFHRTGTSSPVREILLVLTNNAGNLSWKPRRTDKPREQASRELALSDTSLALGHWVLSLYPTLHPLPLLCVSWLCLGQEVIKDKMAWTK